MLVDTARGKHVTDVMERAPPVSLSGRSALISYTLEERDALAEWLETFKWTFFLTVTFRWWARPEQAQSHFEYVRRALARYHPERLFLGAELHKKGDLHLHGIYAEGDGAYTPGFGTPRAIDIWSLLYKRFGRSKVEAVRNPAAVVSYCTKYVTKQLTDYNIW